MKKMKRKTSIFSAFFIAFFSFFTQAVLASVTCPDLTQNMFCSNMTSGNVCEGWTVQKGIIHDGSNFEEVWVRNTFPFTVTCQYDKGRLALTKQGRAAPTLPYLWCYQCVSGLSFLSCNASLEQCDFTLAQ